VVAQGDALDRLLGHLAGATQFVELTPVAVAYANEKPQAGLTLLEALDGEIVRTYQPWWAARAELLNQSGRFDEARNAYGRALALASDPALRRWLEQKLRQGTPVTRCTIE
jgi:predicted RNA polymerase sigma factor